LGIHRFLNVLGTSLDGIVAGLRRGLRLLLELVHGLLGLGPKTEQVARGRRRTRRIVFASR